PSRSRTIRGSSGSGTSWRRRASTSGCPPAINAHETATSEFSSGVAGVIEDTHAALRQQIGNLGVAYPPFIRGGRGWGAPLAWRKGRHFSGKRTHDFRLSVATHITVAAECREHMLVPQAL